MKLICESCQTRYSISDDKVRGKNKVFKIKCRSCGETIVVKGIEEGQSSDEQHEDDATTVAPAPSAMEDGTDDGWYVVVAGEQVGPLSRAAVLDHLTQGAIDDAAFVWRQGFEDWKKLNDVDAFRAALGDAAPAAPAEPQGSNEDDATMLDSQLPDNVRALVESEKAAALASVAAARAEEAAASQAAPAKAADDDEMAMTRMVPTETLETESARRTETASSMAAVTQPQRTSTGQMKARSLESFFGEEDEPPAPAEDAGGFFGDEPKAADSGPMLYQRRETSVLFSLNEFKKDKAKEPAGGLSKETRTKDSGLIDIRAVARKETKARQARQTAGDLFADFGGGAEAEAPVEMSTRLETAAASPLLQKKQSKAPLWIALAAVLVIGGAVGVWFAFFKDKGTTQPAPQPTAQAQQPAAPAGEPGKAPEGEARQPEQPAQPAQNEPEKQPEQPAQPEQVAAADAGAHAQADGGAAAAAAQADADGEQVAAAEGAEGAEGSGSQGATDPGKQEPEKTPAEKAAAEKAAKELAKKKAEEAKKRAEEKAMQMKEAAETAKKAPQPPVVEKKPPVVAQNTGGNSATDLLNMVQTQQKTTSPEPPKTNGGGDTGGLPDKLSASVVRKVIREHQSKVVGCYRTHGGGGAGAVTINTSITVGGDGNVRSARVTTGEYSGNAVGSCISSALKGMHFPKFGADSQSISIPFRVQ